MLSARKYIEEIGRFSTYVNGRNKSYIKSPDTIYCPDVKHMSEDSRQILETIRRRELDIEILQLQLKHNLTEKRAESKLMIMYYKACNAISRTRLMVYGINGYDVKAPQPPNSVDQPNNNPKEILT